MIKNLIITIFDIYKYRKQTSLKQYFKYHRAKNAKLESEPISLTLKKSIHPFWIRPGTSDWVIFRDFFLEESYAKTDSKITNMNIIDAGANIGAASFLLKQRHPESNIFAIEPDASNCKMYKLNMAPFSNIILFENGLHHTNDLSLKILNPDASKYSFQLGQDSDELNKNNELSVNSISINNIVDTFKLEKIDIVKIDIEGGEKSLFEFNTEWLNKCDQLIIELHEHYAPGCSASLIRAISSYNFKIGWAGENFVLTKNN
jgi:FkbM family methyltransferase